MKRRLIDYAVFERINNDSLSNAASELQEAAPVLAKALNVEDLRLHCYGPDAALFETRDGSFVHAAYTLKEGFIEFDNVEQLVLNEETEQAKSRELLTKMLDALLEADEKQADVNFDEWLDLPRTGRVFKEAKEMRTVPIRKDGKITGYKKARWETNPKSKEPSSKTNKRMKGKIKKQKKLPDSQKKLLASKRKKVAATIGEWAGLCDNVFNYLEFRTYGPALNESQAKHDENGNVIAIRIPNKKLRNEAKLLEFDWKTLNTDVVVKRNGAKHISEDMEFAQAIAQLKRHNNLSDDNSLEESLENIISKWPQVLYLTQGELAGRIKEALEVVGATNFDDQTCEFMAEGILRKAHSSYVDRVAKVLRLAGTNVTEAVEDKYLAFQTVVEEFYPHLDERNALEMQVFVDLYEALRHVHDLATDEENHILRSETARHLDELIPILEQKVEPCLEVAEAAAEWLYDLVETNLEGSDWNVSNNTHVTVSGDHPDMAKKAKHGYNPASDFSGDYGDTAPASDGKSYKGGHADEMRNRSWGNISGSDTYPSLSNPYVPSPFGDYKIKGEKHIDADSGHLGHWGTSDTWPGLQNPYVPKAETPQTYKMNKGKEADLVVDK